MHRTKLFLSVLTILGCTNTSFAQDVDSAQLEEQMTSALEPMIEQFGNEMADGFEQMVAALTQAMAPMMVMLEENKNLIPIDSDMENDIKSSLKSKYTADSSFQVDNDLNQFDFTGKYEEDETVLQYAFTRNIGVTLMIDNFIKGNHSGNVLNGMDTKMYNLKKESRDIKEFRKVNANGHEYFGYLDRAKQEVFIAGLISPYLAVRIQVNGPQYHRVFEDFLNSLDYDAMKKASKYDGGTLKAIDDKIKLKLEDEKYMEQLMRNNNDTN